jgi:predicted dehydrogenase
VGSAHRIGIVGLGFISRTYLDTLAGLTAVKVTAVADLDSARATDVASQLPSAVAMSVDELLASPDVDSVLNLTIPAAHAEIARRAIAHGKNVYGEKPLAADLDDARAIVTEADAAGVQVWCAPDTVLGTGIQTARAAVEQGAIGHVVGASAIMTSRGHELWHPQPDFYYRAGGGPLLDMGPYYITALVHLLGPVASVVGATARPRDEREIATGPRAGESIAVEIDTHVVALLQHHSGAISTLTMSFDSADSAAPHIELLGDRGSLTVPDPNQFTGDVVLRTPGAAEPAVLAPSAGYTDASRGIGLVDAAAGHGRAGAALALHVTEVMAGVLAAARDGARLEIASLPALPDLVPLTPAGEWRGLTHASVLTA